MGYENEIATSAEAPLGEFDQEYNAAIGSIDQMNASLDRIEKLHEVSTLLARR